SYSIEVGSHDVENLQNETTYQIVAVTQNNGGFPAQNTRNFDIKLTPPTIKILSPLSGSIMISDTISGTGKNI
ncbi:MAG TPA: hypothetical protein VIY47_15065, partial [Ignavibacteriaceae bacterium]